MNAIETKKQELELELALCKAEISQMQIEIDELNASLASSYRIILNGSGSKVNFPENSSLNLKPTGRIRLLYRLEFWLKSTKAKSIFNSLPGSVRSLIRTIARKLGLV
jgi:hypothetical protein